jgi:putative DNA primase/helicase
VNTVTTKNKSVETAERFLKAWDGDDAPGYIAISYPKGKDFHTEFFASNLDAAARAVELSQQYDVWHSCGRRERVIEDGGRGGTEDVISIGCFWGEIDYSHAVHKKSERLPHSREAALELLREFPVPPSMVYHTGHGIQFCWLFREPWTFDNEADRIRAQALLNRLKATFARLADAHGYKLDAVADLARVLRVVGTYNRKEPTTVLPVEYIEFSPDLRYDPSEIEEYLVTIEPKERASIAAGSGLDADDATLIDRAKSAGNGTRFKSLWDGSTGGHGSDASAADLALCNMLAFWTGPDTTKIDRLFRRSGLMRDKWDVVHSSTGDTYGAMTISVALDGRTEFYDPNRNGKAKAKLADPVDRMGSQPAQAASFVLTDAGNGERLFHRHGDKLRFVALWKKPICYTGSYWAVDETSAVDRLALETIRALKAEGARLAQSEDDEQHLLGLKYQKHAHACEATKKKRDMVGEASKVKGAMIMPDRLDADPWLLNVKNGTIDLRTAELRPHNRLDYITKICPVEYDEFAKCPTFEAFLKAVFANKPRLISFVRRAIGYTLTGIATERAMFFHYGIGANGKSTLLGVVRELMGDYSTQTAADTLMAKRNEGIPNDIARLKGARYVSAVETDEGRYLAEGLIKRMTGGEDVLTGRFLHAEFFDFKPEFKLHLATNYKPMIRGTDPAIWDRVKLIPYDVRFFDDREEALKQCGDPTRVKDKDLPAKLRDELPGILAWAVAGCIEWQAEGLGATPEVVKATKAYREEMDRLGDWIDERCEVGSECSAFSSELFGNYQKWAETNGEKPMNQTAFGRQLTVRGHATVRDGNYGRKQRIGIALKNV